MDFSAFLSPADAERAHRTLAMLRRHRIEALVLTGGLAIELHCLRFGLPAQTRPLNDIDFLVDSFDEIPQTLSADLLFRHVHPHDSPARTLMQSVDPKTGVRVDIFRACGKNTARVRTVEICGASMRIIALEDLTARTARLCLDLDSNVHLPAKHARDFLRLLPLVQTVAMEPVWSDHRKLNHPQSFAAAALLLRELIAARKDLQITPVYSRDETAACSRCKATDAFPLADPQQVLDLLGYC